MSATTFSATLADKTAQWKHRGGSVAYLRQQVVKGKLNESNANEFFSLKIFKMKDDTFTISSDDALLAPRLPASVLSLRCVSYVVSSPAFDL